MSTLGLLLCATLNLSGCATSEEVKLRMRVAELELLIAGKDDDNAMLMRALAEQQGYIGELERGSMWQAGQIARLRDGKCDI